MSEKNLKSKDGKWTVDYSVKVPGQYVERHGRRVAKLRRVRAVFPTKTEARNYLAVVNSQRAMKKIGVDVPDVKKGDTLFEEFVEKVLARDTANRPATRTSRRGSLAALLRSEHFKGRKLSDITVEGIAAYHSARGVDRKASANLDLTFLKMIFLRAVEWGELTRSPAAPVKKFRMHPTKLRILSDDEVELLFAASSPAQVPIWRLLLTTGMRPHEVFNLHWAHDGWDTERGLRRAIVALDKRIIFVPGLLAKNHKDRTLYLSPELMQMFRDLPRDPKTTKVFGYSNCPRGFRAAVRAARLKSVTLYTLKHTFASRMIKAGVDIVSVSEILGHSNLQQTLRYCHADEESKRDAIEKASKIYFKPVRVADAAPAPESTTEAGEAVS